MPSPSFILALLLTICFTLATWLQPRAANWNQNRARPDDFLAIIFGDARRLFAQHFFVKADVYFHSGYYPSIFDQARNQQTHIAEEAGGRHARGEGGHEDELNFLGPPRDWIEKFGRNFFNTEHTELSGADVREILPWMRIAAELDPQQVDTYTVGAFFLRTQIKKPVEAEQFLRDGLRANKDSYEILFELGSLYDEDYKDVNRARNIWQLAESKLEAQEAASGEVDLLAKRKILVHLARLEEDQGNLREAIGYLQRVDAALAASEETQQQRPEIQKQIDELKQKLTAHPQ
jgi:hypothetical protein